MSERRGPQSAARGAAAVGAARARAASGERGKLVPKRDAAMWRMDLLLVVLVILVVVIDVVLLLLLDHAALLGDVVHLRLPELREHASAAR